MWFRYLTTSTACAALLGLAASGFVRTHIPEVVSALAPRASEASSESIRAEGGSALVLDRAPEGATPAEPRPTSLLPPKKSKEHPAACARSGLPHNPARDTFAQKLDRGIRKLAERRYEIKRGTLELALGNLGLLARSVRVTPVARDGKPFGFRLFAMAPDGPFAKLGLRNDDVLVSINGLALATPEGVLDAFGKLKKAPRLVLGLVRDNREITQEYSIR
jgi:hypothetical protein